MLSDTPQKSEKAKNLAWYVLAFSMFSLAIAIVYFTWQIGKISQQVPEVLDQIEQTSLKIEPMIKQVSEIKDLIPPLVSEVSEIRKQVPLILEEVKLSREQISPVIAEVKALREQLPVILQTVDKASEAVVLTANEIKATRPLVPTILAEVKTTREAIPGMLDRADELVLNVTKAGKKASEGAVSGVLTGIIRAPFEMVGNLGKKVLSFSNEEIKELTEKDLNLMQLAIHQVLSSEDINYSKKWHNKNSDITGQVTLLDVKNIDDRTCKTIHSKVVKSNKSFIDKELIACLNEQGSWE